MKNRQLKPGSLITCHLRDGPKFFGQSFQAKVVAITPGAPKPILVASAERGEVSIARNEIKRIRVA
jgi:hypothetical protein